ncbi:feruloyl esteras-like protein B precursor [Aulographum hederae CBS 113979]|uniref:Carboxylic ester hydrolase n=1 Tax=Aulographum hederae CBS 113979 TaxID=1176131 RepID=A0A6G1GJP8_9PEZI|nr:feruloyl esteras-like protein B precursor [Aulographum hederae CBS 113979]
MSNLQQVLAPLPCTPGAITLPDPFGTAIISVDASPVFNLSKHINKGLYVNHGAIHVESIDFCNFTVAYTHPGHHDLVNVQMWLPMNSWNGRMQAIGGAGWSAGISPFADISLAGAVAEGYAALTTDGGHASENSVADWALLESGKVDFHTLEDFASVSLNDSAYIGKSVVKAFYGRPPEYSYWSGCSQGGRQGMMLAQKYPNAYDGIVASAPAIYWGQFVVAGLWLQVTMNALGSFPRPCEFRALTSAAISACDGNDGVVDGVISEPGLCQFDPLTLVGTAVNCEGDERVEISKAAATVAKIAWDGLRSWDGSLLWYGLNHEADLTGFGGLADTTCDTAGSCKGLPNSLFADWVKVFIKRNPRFDPVNITKEEFERIFHDSVQEYDSTIGTAVPDLSAFHDRGGKLADQIITPYGTRRYYNAMIARDPKVHDYYRVFEAPGVAHCFHGRGFYPDGIFDKMVDWVEKGEAPDRLNATSFEDNESRFERRILCPYPQKVLYDGEGDPTLPDSFYCGS